MTDENIKQLREFLIKRGLLEVYCKAVLDDRTRQRYRPKLKYYDLLTALHSWISSEEWYPSVSSQSWQEASTDWVRTCGDTKEMNDNMETRAQMVSRLLNSSRTKMLSYISRLKD